MSENPVQMESTDQAMPPPSQTKRANPSKTLQVCRYYFLGGFFCLPFLWLVNVLWFFPEAFGHAEFPRSSDEQEDSTTGSEQKALARRYVLISLLGVLVWTGALGSWIFLYQTRRAEWGEFGDYISAIIPQGKP